MTRKLRGSSAPITLALLVGLILIAGCSGDGAPTPTPGGMDDVLPALALRGATVHQSVSGDAGCPGSPLRSNAARLEISVAGDQQRYSVYLFRWRRPAHFEAAAQPFDQCLAEFLAQSDGEVPIDQVEAPPWRAYGPGWSEDVLVIVEDALRDLSGT
ncbi:MAG TPA: hypothetical protein VM305_07945 [Candidatus Limnocylindrales bacterium]|nr:hypothetical protein [Candidatus Limnocylindrales bacterium]